MFGHLALAAGGGLVGLLAARQIEKASLSPVAMGATEVGTGLIGGALAAMLSPAVGFGIAGGLGLSGGAKLFDAVTAPSSTAPKTAQTQSLGFNPSMAAALAQQNAAVQGLEGLSAVELQMGAVTMGDPRYG